jgi:hypothetical protein
MCSRAYVTPPVGALQLYVRTWDAENDATPSLTAAAAASESAAKKRATAVGVVVAEVPALTLLLGEGVSVDDTVPVPLLDAVAVSEAVSLHDGVALPLEDSEGVADKLGLFVPEAD